MPTINKESTQANLDALRHTRSKLYSIPELEQLKNKVAETVASMFGQLDIDLAESKRLSAAAPPLARSEAASSSTSARALLPACSVTTKHRHCASFLLALQWASVVAGWWISCSNPSQRDCRPGYGISAHCTGNASPLSSSPIFRATTANVS